VVREFATLSCFPVDNDRLSCFQALGESLDGSLEEVVLRPETLYAGIDFGVMAIAVGDDPGGVARGAVIGAHGSFRGAAGLNVVLDKCSLLGGEVKTYISSCLLNHA